MLAPLQVRRADGTRVRDREWRTSKTADLVRWLAVRAGDPVPADVLVEQLWPSVDPVRGRASLRTAVAHVRRVLGGDCVERRLDGLVLRDAWVDAVAFTRLVAEVRHLVAAGDDAHAVTTAREALGLHLQPLRASDDEAAWVRHEREVVARAHDELLVTAAEAAVRLGWMADAVELAGRAVQLDPLEERAARALAAGWAGLGETDRALRELERCRRDVAESTGADLSAQTRALHLQILNGAAPPDRAVVPFTGRRPELGWLTDLLAGQRRAQLVVLSGPPGSGRRRLVSEASSGRRVVTATAPPDGAPLDLVRTLAGARGGGRAEPVVVVPPGVEVDAGSVGALLDGEGPPGAGGAVVLLEDVRAPAAPGVGVRPPRVAGPRGAELHHLPLGPLSEEESAELAAGVLAGEPAPSLTARLQEESGGLPGPLVAAATEWVRGGRVVATTEGLALAPAPGAAPAGDDAGVLLNRAVTELSDDELEVLSLAAFLDGPVTPAVLQPLLTGTDGTAVAAARALAHLVDLSMLRAGAAGFTWRHPLVRDAVRAWVRPMVRVALHRRIAGGAVIPAEQRVEHWLAAGERALACGAALEAATAATTRGDYGTARAALRRVTSLGGLEGAAPVDVVELCERLGDACALLRRPDEARAAWQDALRAALEHGVPGAERLRAKVVDLEARDWLETGPSFDGPAALDEGTSVAAEVTRRAGVGPLAPADEDTARRLAAVLEAADRAGDTAVAVEARLLLSGVVHLPRREFRTARRLATEAVSHSVEPLVRARALLHEHFADALLGGGAHVREELAEADELAGRAGDERVARSALNLRLAVAHDLALPELEALRERAEELLARDRSRGEGTSGLLGVAARVLLERGAVERVERLLAEHPVELEAGHGAVQLAQLATAAVLRARGESAAAQRVLQELLAASEASRCVLVVPEAAAKLVLLLADRDLPAAAAAFDRCDRALGEATGMPREAVLRLLARAAVRHAAGEEARADDARRDAAATARAAGLVHLPSGVWVGAARRAR